jgi:hypothetical protein
LLILRNKRVKAGWIRQPILLAHLTSKPLKNGCAPRVEGLIVHGAYSRHSDAVGHYFDVQRADMSIE